MIFLGPKDTQVYINGKNIGKLPLSQQIVPEGTYSILLNRGNLGQQSKTVKVKRREITQISWE